MAGAGRENTRGAPFNPRNLRCPPADHAPAAGAAAAGGDRRRHLRARGAERWNDLTTSCSGGVRCVGVVSNMLLLLLLLLETAVVVGAAHLRRDEARRRRSDNGRRRPFAGCLRQRAEEEGAGGAHAPRARRDASAAPAIYQQLGRCWRGGAIVINSRLAGGERGGGHCSSCDGSG